MKHPKISALVAALLLVLVGCRDTAIPKPRGYFRIDLAEHTYRAFESDCPFVLPVSEDAFVQREPGATNGCWFNLVYPRHKAKIHFTYTAVTDEDQLALLVNDAYGLAFEHEVKADAIRRSVIEDDERRAYGLIYDLKGHVATPLQFYLTDSTNHFLRGALYFSHRPNPDSLAPVQEWIREDVVHLIEQMTWTP